MKRKFLPDFLLVISLFASVNSVLAQKNFAYAITGETHGNINWTVVRQVDLATGVLIRNVYVPAVDKPLLFDALTGKQVTVNTNFLQPESNLQNNAQVLNPSMSAAAAYDAKYNRLYFTTLMGSDLRYIDLNSQQLKIYYVRHQLLKQFQSQPGEADNITRMVFGADGYGYALTNSGDHLIRFSSGQKVAITDLGSLKDGKKNGETSVHEQSASWGGDMIADVYGNLYLFSIKGNVFKINPHTLVADHIGAVKDIPEDYTVNAAAVDEEGNVVISSALNDANYYRVNLKTLKATELPKKEDKVYNASDFANCNFAYQNDLSKKIAAPQVSNNAVSIFPNPAKGKNFTIKLNAPVAGNVMVELTTLDGKKVFNRFTNLSQKQSDKITLPSTTLPGMYAVRVINAEGKSIYTDKIMVE